MLEEFPIKLKHIPGKSNGRADALSRCADYDQGEGDNEDVVVLPEEIFIRTLTTLPPQDERTLKPWINAHNLVRLQGKWWKDNCEVVTAEPIQRRQIISQHHDPPTMGHPGISRTTQLIRQHFWWPKLTSESNNTSRAAPNVSETRRIPKGKRPPYHPYSLNRTRYHFPLLQWTSLSSYPNHKATIPS